MSAVVEQSGRMRPLDRPAEPEEQVTEPDVADDAKLSRYVMRLLRDVARLRRRWWPRRIDFRDLTVTAAGTVRLGHGFGGRVNYWVLCWESAGSTYNFRRNAATDNNTLVLDVGTTGTGTIRVEEAG